MKFIKHNNISKRSIIFTWFLSYLLVLFLPLLFGITLYIESEKIIGRQIDRYNEIISAMLLAENDNRILNDLKTVAAVAINDNIQSAFRINDPLTMQDQILLYDLKKELANYHTQSYELGSGSNFYLYFKNINRIVDASRVSNTELFFGTTYSQNNKDYEQWLASMNISEPEYVSIKGEDGRQRLCYIIPFPRESEPMGAFVIEKPQPSLAENVSKLAKDQISMEYVIMTGRNKLYQATEAFADMDADSISELFEKGGGKAEISGKGYYLQAMTSTATGYKYLTAVSDSNAGELLSTMRGFGLLMIALSLCGGVILIFCMIRYNYSPLKSMVEGLRAKMPDASKDGQNEIEFIRSTVTKMIGENAYISDRLDSQNKEIRSYMVYEMLTGQMEMPLADIEQRGFSFPGENFCVALFYVEDCSRLFEGENKDKTVRFRTIEFLLENIAEDIFRGDMRGYVTNANGILALLTSFSEESEESCKQKMLDALSEIQQLMEENLFISFTISISNIARGFPEIENAYHEALKAMEYKFSLGTNLIITQEDIGATQDSQYTYSQKTEQLLINYIKTSDAEKAAQLIEEILSSRQMPIDTVRCIAYNIAGTMLRMVDEKDEELSKRLFSFETIDEFKQNILSVSRELCERNVPQKGEMLCAKVKKVVEEQYSNPGLSVGYIADYLGIQYVYLSSSFKSYTGEGILEYIGKVRVEKGKEYLKNPLLSIDEVAEKVGYTTPKTFVRVFRKNEGVTPAKYREHAVRENIT